MISHPSSISSWVKVCVRVAPWQSLDNIIIIKPLNAHQASQINKQNDPPHPPFLQVSSCNMQKKHDASGHV